MKGSEFVVERLGVTAAIDAETLTRIAAQGWPAVENDPLGAWTLRASGGFTRRANSVLALGDPGVPFDEAVAHVTSWYARRGLPAYVQLLADTSVDAAFAARQWESVAPVHFQIAPVNIVLGALHGVAGTEELELADAPDAAWLARYHKSSAAPEAARAVLCGGPMVRFARVRGEDPARAKAIGRCVIVGTWAGFSAVEVDPAHRRRGLAQSVMRALVERAAELGATNLYLQVETDNTAALALYARLGFTTHHDYHYRRVPLASAGTISLPAAHF